MAQQATKRARSRKARATQQVWVSKHSDGKWHAYPGHKHVQRGDDVNWQFRGCSSWSLDLPGEIFAGDLTPSGGPDGEYTATVKASAPSGRKDYAGTCDRRTLHGTSPGIIVDP